MRFVRAFLLTILILVFTVGLVICLWPQLVGLHLGYQAHVAVSDFFELADADEVAESEKLPVSLEYVEAPESTPVPTYQELYAAMQEYNENIYATGQSGLCDAWAYQQPSFNLTAYGVESNTIGVINIPAMNVELPIYLGATSENMLADFLDMESSLLVNFHIQSIDQTKAIKTVKRKITDLDRSKIEEQKKAVRAGYDMDIIPSDLATYGEEAKKLLQDLQSRNERMFLVTFIILNTADTPRQLDNNVFQASSIAQKYKPICYLHLSAFQDGQMLHKFLLSNT